MFHGTLVMFTCKGFMMEEIDTSFCQDVLDNGQALIWMAGLDKGCYYFNKPWLEFRGRTLEEECGNGWVQGVHPEDFERCLDLYITAFDKHEKFSIVYRLLRYDGAYRWILDEGAPRFDRLGQFIGYIGHCLDVTETEQAIKLANITEQKLQESESRFHTLMEHIPSVAVQGYTLDGKVIFWNEASERLYGYSKKEALSGNLLDLIIPPQMQEDVKGAMKWMAQSGESIPAGELLLQRKDGSRVPVFSSHGLVKYIDTPPELFCLDIDLSEQKKAQDALRESETRFQALHNASFGGIAIHDKGMILDCNEGLSKISGYSVGELIGMNGLLLIAEDSRSTVMANILSGYEKPYEVFGRHKDGHEYPLRLEAREIPYRGKNVRVVEFRDITEEKKAQEELRLAASVFTQAREGILISDANGIIINVNDAFANITGYSHDEAIGKKPNILKSGRHDDAFYADMWRALVEKDHWYGEIWNRRKNGEIYVEMLTISAIKDDHGHTSQYMALFSDISIAKEHERQLEYIAYHDALTRLPNRILLGDRLRQGMAHAKRYAKRLVVAYLDLDGFKIINDRYGHESGDKLLVALSLKMKQLLREGDTLARLGGDEFVLVLNDMDDIETSIPMLLRILTVIAQPIEIGGLELQVSASIGVTFYPQDEEMEADQMLRQADQAMYQAKLAGKNRYHIFDDEQDRSVRGYHESLEHIRHALSHHEFVLYYQPKVNMRTGKMIGVEALIRWQHPIRGLLSPAAFLPIIEDHPLAISLGEWVINAALTQISKWKALGLNVPVSVNVGAKQLQQGECIACLRRLLQIHADVDPSLLELEILETSTLEDLIGVSNIIKECHSMGITFALDDFGTGYSSLTYLKKLPVTSLKIDQTFVHDMLDDPDDLAILEGVLGLARAFSRQVIAEGVETIEQGEMLLQLGCELAQGYIIARPMPAFELPSWLASWSPSKMWVQTTKVHHDNLPLLFATVEHRSWVKMVENFLESTLITPPVLKEYQCRFGIWLRKEGLSRGSEVNFQEINAIHMKLHQIAEILYRKKHLPVDKVLVDEFRGLSAALLERLKIMSVSKV